MKRPYLSSDMTKNQPKRRVQSLGELSTLSKSCTHFLIIHPFNYQDFAHGISKFTQLHTNGLTFCMQLCKDVKPFFSYTACLLDCWLH